MKNTRVVVAAAMVAATVVAVVFTLAIPIASAVSSQELPMPIQAATNPAGQHDFDFISGQWRVHHRRLKERLAGNHDWVEFEGTSTSYKLMDGWGNVDDNVIGLPEGAYRAAGLRSYDPKTGLWAIWWHDGRTPSADLDPPVKGRFENGVGAFYCDDTFKGKPIRVRYTWSRITPTSAHWEQAFSPDAGKTWETNWMMDFQRRS